MVVVVEDLGKVAMRDCLTGRMLLQEKDAELYATRSTRVFMRDR